MGAQTVFQGNSNLVLVERRCCAASRPVSRFVLLFLVVFATVCGHERASSAFRLEPLGPTAVCSGQTRPPSSVSGGSPALAASPNSSSPLSVVGPQAQTGARGRQTGRLFSRCSAEGRPRRAARPPSWTGDRSGQSRSRRHHNRCAPLRVLSRPRQSPAVDRLDPSCTLA